MLFKDLISYKIGSVGPISLEEAVEGSGKSTRLQVCPNGANLASLSQVVFVAVSSSTKTSRSSSRTDSVDSGTG